MMHIIIARWMIITSLALIVFQMPCSLSFVPRGSSSTRGMMPSPPVELLVKTTTTATRAVAVGERREGRPRQIVFNIYDTRGACLVRSLGRVMELQAVGRSTPEDGAPDEIEFDIETQLEAERIMQQLESGAERTNIVPDGGPKYMPSTQDGDPIVQALKSVLRCRNVTGWELLDSRWNGNEALRWDTDRGPFFVKMNRVEDVSVFMTEAVSLSALAKADVMQVPKPLHLGKLPKVGDVGPGAFMILEYLPLVPFGPMRPGNQVKLGNSLADLHLSKVHDALHKGRFGFPLSNFLALTPLNNTWCDSWTDFFRRRLIDQIEGLEKDKVYGRAALMSEDPSTRDTMARLRKVVEVVDDVLDGADVSPSLLHGDLWIGNTGATLDGPCMFDPASFFGHSEFELAIMDMFGGFRGEFWDAYHAKIPKAAGFGSRQRVYKLYHYLNQLNLFGDPNVRKTVEGLANDILTDLR